MRFRVRPSDRVRESQVGCLAVRQFHTVHGDVLPRWDASLLPMLDCDLAQVGRPVINRTAPVGVMDEDRIAAACLYIVGVEAVDGEVVGGGGGGVAVDVEDLGDLSSWFLEVVAWP